MNRKVTIMAKDKAEKSSRTYKPQQQSGCEGDDGRAIRTPRRWQAEVFLQCLNILDIY